MAEPPERRDLNALPPDAPPGGAPSTDTLGRAGRVVTALIVIGVGVFVSGSLLVGVGLSVTGVPVPGAISCVPVPAVVAVGIAAWVVWRR